MISYANSVIYEFKLPRYYKKQLFFADLFESEYSSGQSKQTTRLMNILMQLRKCVNHPYLFDGKSLFLAVYLKLSG